MDPTVAAMVLVSAALHPLWNALVKRDSRPESAFLCMLVLIVCIAGVQAMLTGVDLFGARRVLPEILVSWVGQLLYATALVATLRRGDLSAYYPIVRSSPLFVVLVGVTVLGERYSWVLLLGIGMVLAGAVLLQWKPGGLHGGGRGGGQHGKGSGGLGGDGRTLALALLAMMGTGIYAMADARAMHQVEPVVMLFWVHLATAPAYALLVRMLGASKTGGLGIPSTHPGIRAPLARLTSQGAAAALAYGSYYLILLAFGLGGNVAAVTAVRQASIPISVLIGAWFLREPYLASRLGASLVLTAGIVVIVFSP